MSARPVDPKMIANLLAAIPEVRPETLLNVVNSALDRRMIVSESASPRVYFFNIVQACLASAQARDALVTAVDFLAPDSRECEQIAMTLSVAAPTLPASEEQQIQDLLRQCRVDNLGTLYAVATHGAPYSHPRGLVDVWSTYNHLVNLNTRPGELPPDLRFVGLVVRHLLHQDDPPSQDLVDGLRRWAYQQCDRLRAGNDNQAAEELDRLVRLAPPFQTRDDYPISLIVEIDRLPAPNDERDLHQVTSWRQSDQTRWRPVRGEDRDLPAADVVAYVVGLVKEAEESWGYGVSGPLLLQFILSRELINLAVDQWPLPVAEGLAPRLLGMDYEVVLRSNSLLRPRHLHRQWQARWERFLRGEGDVHLVSPSEPVDPDSLRTDLGNSEHIIAYVLSAPPDHETGRREFDAAIHSGLPILLWCREIEHNDAFRATLTEVIQPPRLLKKLPTSIKRLRSSAHICSNVALLWDDPNHTMPEVTPLRRP